MVYIVYHYVFVGGVVVFDRVGQLSDFANENTFFVFFINKLFNEVSRVTVIVLEFGKYLWNWKCLVIGKTFL